MTDEMPQIRRLHGIYEDLSGMSAMLSMEKVSAWREFIGRGYTEEDLKLVLRMLAEKVRRGEKRITCFRFSWLITRLEYFDEDLGEAKALTRINKPTARDKALLRSGRPVQPGLGENCKSAEDVMKGNSALAELLRLRDSL